MYANHECLQQISIIDERKPRIQCWMEFLSRYDYRLSYRQGRGNANANFLWRLPLPPTVEDISGSSALSDPDDLGVYVKRACDYIALPCPIPGVGLGGMAPSSYPTPCTGLDGIFPQPATPVLGGLPQTTDDFRTHRAPMPAPHMTGPTTRPFAVPTKQPCLSYAIDDQHDASRTNCAKRTQSQTAILAGNTPLRRDYRTAARSGFAASAAPTPPPKASFRSSPPPRSARLGSTILLGCYASPRPKPAASNPPLDHSRP